MKSFAIHFSLLTVLLTTPYAYADDIQMYNPNGTTQVPAPAQQQAQPVQQSPAAQQQSTAKPEFKQFNISGNKSPVTHKKKKKKTKKQVEKPVEAAVPAQSQQTIVQNANEPPRYIDIPALLARSKALQLEASKESSVATQIDKSTQSPDEAIRDKAKTVFTYIPGNLYTIWCKEGFLTDIQLQIGESITSVGGGDTSRWIVEEAVSGGNGTPEIKHIQVRPWESDLQTNIIINTDRRSYQLKAISTKNTYNPIVSWLYPADEKSAFLFVQKQKKIEEEKTVNEEPIAPENLYFKYKIKSDACWWNSCWFNNEYPWTPVKVFNDGSKTYIQVNPQMKNNEAPALFVKDRNGNINLVNTRHKDNYFIVDRLFDTAEMRNGTDEIVTIIKEN